MISIYLCDDEESVRRQLKEVERERLRLPLCLYHSRTICAVSEDLLTAGPHRGNLTSTRWN